MVVRVICDGESYHPPAVPIPMSLRQLLLPITLMFQGKHQQICLSDQTGVRLV